MNIIEHNWTWAHSLARRARTDAIVLHHAAAKTASPEDVHAWHLHNGWAGIGYHLYIRRDGSVHAGRPLWASGAHTLNYNSSTLGVCCEGNYDVETAMPDAQLRALRETLAYLKTLYPAAPVRCHRDYNATACPGKYFPLEAALDTNAGGASPAPTATTGSACEPAPETHTKEEPMKRYKTIEELPKWARKDIRDLVERGVLKGTGGEAGLDLTEDMARVLVVCARMGGAA